MSERLATPRAGRLSAWGLLGILLTLGVVAGLWAYGPRVAAISALMPGSEPPGPITPALADATARRAEVAFADAQAVWARRFPDEVGRSYAPAGLTHFVDGAPSPCAGANTAAGPFYCAVTRSAAMDLGFLEQLGRRLRVEGDLGVALFVARVAAAHVRAEVGAGGANASDLAAALEADCLTGIWAREAEPRLGPASATLYGRLIEAARIVARERMPFGAVQPDPTLLGPGRIAARAAAFERGRAGGTIAGCRSPA